MINGQLNLFDAIRGQVDFNQGEKEYKLRTDRVLPTLICRSRGWHLEEAFHRRWPAHLRLAVRLWAVLFQQCRGVGQEGPWAILLPAQDGEPFGGAIVE